jgi:hypothetical protein
MAIRKKGIMPMRSTLRKLAKVTGFSTAEKM